MTTQEKIVIDYRKSYKCACGGKYTSNNKSRHIKTKKHIEFLNGNPKRKKMLMSKYYYKWRVYMTKKHFNKYPKIPFQFTCSIRFNIPPTKYFYEYYNK